MPTGIRAEVRIERPGTCEVAPVSETHEVGEVVRGTASTDDATVEFTVLDGAGDVPAEATPVFESGARTVYRISDEGGACVCDRIERLGCPVRDITVDDGTVTATFLVADIETLQRVIGDLKEAFDGVSIRRLTRSECGDSTDDLVYVDRSALTTRQREVLRRAHGLGYFEHPRRANAREVAADLGIAPATFREHLAAAQRKLMDAVLESG